MDLNKLDELWNNLDTYSDSELNKLYVHSINMQYKFQESEDELALEYWAALAQMIICQREIRSHLHV